MLILIALVSTVSDSSADSEEQTAEAVDMNLSVTSETEAVPEASETDVKSETVTGELTTEPAVSESELVTETSETEYENM